MNGTNCIEGQILYTLQIILERYRWSDGYRPETFLWKVEAERTILYGSNEFNKYWYPWNETFCLDTELCYDITILQNYIDINYTDSRTAGFKLYAGDNKLNS